MTSLQSKIQRIGTLLAGVTESCYHYHRPQMSAPYILWAEDSEDTGFSGDNRKSEQRIHGVAHYYTPTEYDSTVDDIQDALNDADRVSFQLTDVQYEEETELIHFTWDWWVY